jgi:hypothetical protein
MAEGAGTTDTEFLQQIEACTLPREAFTHRNHVRLAWLYLRDTPGGDPEARIAQTIERYAISLGAVTKFDRALTMRWLKLVEKAIAATPADLFEAFIAARPELLDRAQ